MRLSLSPLFFENVRDVTDLPLSSSIPSGDMREAESYNIVNTGLRRLGCGGRAILGMDYPTYVVTSLFHLRAMSPAMKSDLEASDLAD